MRLLGQFLIWATFAPLIQAGDLVGQVQLKGRNTTEPFKNREAPVVFIEKWAHQIPAHMLKQPYVMETRNKTFIPSLMVVPIGAEVTFTNFDPILHNVFSVSGQNAFDGGLFSKEETTTATFKHNGLVRVYCNVHHEMYAQIYAVENPFFAATDQSGRFEIKNLPAGTYEVVIAHGSAAPVRKTVEVPSTGQVEIEAEIQLRRRKIEPHKNKEGKPYTEARSTRY